jgi:hypothetical protein
MKLLGFLVGHAGDACVVTHGRFSFELANRPGPRWARVAKAAAAPCHDIRLGQHQTPSR